VLFGEIGKAMETECASGLSTPVASFTAGRASPPGKMRHAGAIMSGGVGSDAGRRRAPEGVGVQGR